MQGLNDVIKEAPAGTDTTLLAHLKTLAALGSKTAYTLDDRQQISQAVRQALMAALVFSEGPAFKP